MDRNDTRNDYYEAVFEVVEIGDGPQTGRSRELLSGNWEPQTPHRVPLPLPAPEGRRVLAARSCRPYR